MVIRVGGVPEHFNHVWQMAQDRGLFAEQGVEVEFVIMSMGTGHMINTLKAGELDVIVALTEGLVSDIAGGSDLRLLGTYVGSPLCWAISAAGAESGHADKIKAAEDLQGQTFGISRFTSGSHLMAYVLAQKMGWNPQTDVKFEVKGNFQQLRDGVNDGSTQAFMWETFTTKPFHDSGEVRRVGDITTPWPCFMMATRTSVVDAHLDDLKKVLAAVGKAAQMFHAEKETMPGTIAETFKLQPEDAKAWYSTVSIVAQPTIKSSALVSTVDTLKAVGVIPADKEVDIASLIDDRIAALVDDE